MIERNIIKQKKKELLIQEYIEANVGRAGHSHTKIIKTPLGDKVAISVARPGLIVGKKGQNIKKLTQDLKKKFNLENPQLELNEVADINLDAKIVAERIVNSLERFGASQFKSIGHRTMSDVMNAGALGVEILIGGRGVPGSRAKTWRFYQGYLKKCGDVAVSQVLSAISVAHLKSGSIGIQVKIMPPDLVLPDKITIKTSMDEEVKEEEPKKKAKKKTKKKATKKKAVKKEKKEDKKEEAKEEAKEAPEEKKEEAPKEDKE